jgi:hypothetical protein
MASYYSVQEAWATPYELVHDELFPDASIVVPFGCGVLDFLEKADRAKFKSRCALMLFVHYADDHPLYTYAVYSPLTKRVLKRQYCIFLPKLFPMRIARSSAGMSPDGEPLIPMRSPFGIREGGDPDLFFAEWQESEGSSLTRPRDQEMLQVNPGAIDGMIPHHRPFHPSFDEKSVVVVNQSSGLGVATMIDQRMSDSVVTMGPARL